MICIAGINLALNMKLTKKRKVKRVLKGKKFVVHLFDTKPLFYYTGRNVQEKPYFVPLRKAAKVYQSIDEANKELDMLSGEGYSNLHVSISCSC